MVFETLSFINAYFSYHKVKMPEQDEPQTDFQVAGGLYCSMMIPFTLKNAKATYQCMINKFFDP